MVNNETQPSPSVTYRGERVGSSLEVAGVRRISDDHDAIRLVFIGTVPSPDTTTGDITIAVLAASILSDAISPETGGNEIIATAYAREVVKHLDFTGFELEASAVVAWYDRYQRRPKGAAA